jgi:hypothetical protein
LDHRRIKPRWYSPVYYAAIQLFEFERCALSGRWLGYCGRHGGTTIDRVVRESARLHSIEQRFVGGGYRCGVSTADTSNAYAHPDGYINSDFYPDVDPNGYGYGYADGDCYSDEHSDTAADKHADSDCDGNSGPNGNGDPNSGSDSDAAPAGLPATRVVFHRNDSDLHWDA